MVVKHANKTQVKDIYNNTLEEKFTKNISDLIHLLVRQNFSNFSFLNKSKTVKFLSDSFNCKSWWKKLIFRIDQWRQLSKFSWPNILIAIAMTAAANFEFCLIKKGAAMLFCPNRIVGKISIFSPTAVSQLLTMAVCGEK